MKIIFSSFLLLSFLFTSCGKIDQGEGGGTAFTGVGQSVNPATLKRKLTVDELSLVKESCLSLKSLRESYSRKFENTASAKLLFRIRESLCNSQVREGEVYKRLTKPFNNGVIWEIPNPTYSHDDIAKVETDTNGVLSDFCISTSFGTNSDSYNLIVDGSGGYKILNKIVQDPIDKAYVYQVSHSKSFNNEQIQMSTEKVRLSTNKSHLGVTLEKSKASLCNDDPYAPNKYYIEEKLDQGYSTWPN
jgi:hypothetical protein